MEFLIDADVLYGYIDLTDWLHPYSTKFFEKAEENNYKLKTSAVVVLELAIVTKRDLPDKLFEILDTLKRLKVEILPVNGEIVELAFKFMKEDFGIFDAFHAATAKYYGLAIVGTDHKYEKIDLAKIDPRDI